LLALILPKVKLGGTAPEGVGCCGSHPIRHWSAAILTMAGIRKRGRLSRLCKTLQRGGTEHSGRLRNSTVPRTVVLFLTSGLVSGCSSAGAPSFSLFGAYFPAWLLCGVIGVLGAGAARGVFVATGLSDLLPYQLLVCTAIGVLAACLAWLFGFQWRL
jgi:YtcA family